MEILPAILAHSEREFREKVERVRHLGLTCHIDVMDGEFVPNTTWAPPDVVAKIMAGLPFEVHLMVVEPETHIHRWLSTEAERVFFHAGINGHSYHITKHFHDHLPRLGVAVSPEVSLRELARFTPPLNRIMVMGGRPGFGGQPMREETFDRIAEIIKTFPQAIISVDIGVKPQNIQMLARAGAQQCIAGSALTEAADPVAALTAFKAALG